MSKLNREFENDEMVKLITGSEFRESGALWFVNTILHAFGMAITWNPDTDELKASLVKFRGFAEANNDSGYKKITEYMRDNVEDLLKDCDYETGESQTKEIVEDLKEYHDILMMWNGEATTTQCVSEIVSAEFVKEVVNGKKIYEKLSDFSYDSSRRKLEANLPNGTEVNLNYKYIAQVIKSIE